MGIDCGKHLVRRISEGLLQRAVRQMKRDKIKMDDSKTGLAKIKNYFRQHMSIIVVALLPNPRFDGQTKEKLTLHPKDWGFAAAVSDAMIERLDKKLGLVDKVRTLCRMSLSISVSLSRSVSQSMSVKVSERNADSRLTLSCLPQVLMEAEARNMAALSKKNTIAAGSSARVSIAKYQVGKSCCP